MTAPTISPPNLAAAYQRLLGLARAARQSDSYQRAAAWDTHADSRIRTARHQAFQAYIQYLNGIETAARELGDMLAIDHEQDIDRDTATEPAPVDLYPPVFVSLVAGVPYVDHAPPMTLLSLDAFLNHMQPGSFEYPDLIRLGRHPDTHLWVYYRVTGWSPSCPALILERTDHP